MSSYIVSDEFSNVIFNDHINVKWCKRWSLGDNYFNKALRQSELTLMGVRQNKLEIKPYNCTYHLERFYKIIFKII